MRISIIAGASLSMLIITDAALAADTGPFRPGANHTRAELRVDRGECRELANHVALPNQDRLSGHAARNITVPTDNEAVAPMGDGPVDPGGNEAVAPMGDAPANPAARGTPLPAVQGAATLPAIQDAIAPRDLGTTGPAVNPAGNAAVTQARQGALATETDQSFSACMIQRGYSR